MEISKTSKHTEAENESSASPQSVGALDGVRVLDFTAVMAGPYASRMMADLGAEVVKIESLSGDQVRERPPQRNGKSTYFGHLNAGKKSMALDLKNPNVLKALKTMITEYDIVIENFRPGVMKRLGLDYETLSHLNPRLIYCSISGYGQTGPKSLNPAYAPIVHAASGFDKVNLHYQDDMDAPAATGVFVADVLAGTHAFGAIQAALYQREKSNEGQYIDVSMLDAMIGMLIFETQETQFPGKNRRPLYTPLKTIDDFVIIAPTSPRNFSKLCEVTNRTEWLTDPRFKTNADRNANWSELFDEIEAWTSKHTAEEVESILTAQGVPCSKYRDLSDVMTDPQLLHRGTFTEVSDASGAFKVTNPPFKMSKSRTEARNHIPDLGGDSLEILRAESQLSEETLAKLRTQNGFGES
jgi:crotonobetainyl-CoA:carnitine CoA-transferase CaiB-like acyl-CoA transferase